LRGNPSDPRPESEIDQGPAHDPIANFVAQLTARRIATADQLGQMDDEIEAAVDEAIAFAKASPLPKPEDALLDVFAP
jgi:pyruvate dehydrogenase E1 component alpha subunit